MKGYSKREFGKVLIHYDENGNLLTEVTAKKDGTELSRREYTYITMELPVK